MDYFSGVTEAIKKASVAFTEALSTVSSVLQNIAGQAPAGPDRDRIVENWLRIARMSKDGVVSAIEQGFELWESECRRMMGASPGQDKVERVAWQEEESSIILIGCLSQAALPKREALQTSL